MREIKLTQGKVALVDDADYEKLIKLKWRAKKMGANYYAYHSYRENGKIFSINMHRTIAGLSKENQLIVDHINHNGLDNRRENLRVCNYNQNGANRRKQCGTKSAYKGLAFHVGKWQASIKVNYKNIYLGRFNTEIEAAKAYDAASIKFFGTFANLNIKE